MGSPSCCGFKTLQWGHGAGAHPNPGRAAIKAVTGAAQSRLTYISGARDDIHAETFARPLLAHLRELLFIEPPHDAHALDTSGSPASLVGKIGSVFTSSATQHGCQESTILGFIPIFLHLGMVVAGLPYAFQGQMGTEEVKGGSPYGASTITKGDGSRQPSEIELEGAKYQGAHVAKLA